MAVNFSAMPAKNPSGQHNTPTADRSLDRPLDRIDRRLLVRLQQDGRIPISKLAREVNLTVTPTLERVRRLEAGGFIDGYFARLNALKLGWACWPTWRSRSTARPRKPSS